MSFPDGYLNSQLARRAEKLLKDSDLFYSGSPERHDYRSRGSEKHIRRYSNISGSPDEDLYYRNRRSLERIPSRDIDQSYRRDQSRSRTPKGTKLDETKIKKTTRPSERSRSKSITKKPVKTEKVSEYVPWLKQKALLKQKIAELEKGMDKQEKKIKTLKKQHIKESEELEKLNYEIGYTRRKDQVIKTLEERLRAMQVNEANMIKELDDQQLLARDALKRMHLMQQEFNDERERNKNFYKEYYQGKYGEVQEQNELLIKNLQIEKNQLLSALKNIEAVQDLENVNKEMSLSNQINKLSKELFEKNAECERLQSHVQHLNKRLNDNEIKKEQEMRSLKKTINTLNERVISIQDHEMEVSDRQYTEYLYLKKKNEELQNQLNDREVLLREKDVVYKTQLDQINQRVVSLQNDLEKFQGCEKKILELEGELDMKENELKIATKFYKDKLSEKLEEQEDQKKEWGEIYDELLKEIRKLRVEIDSLGFENTKLKSGNKTPIESSVAEEEEYRRVNNSSGGLFAARKLQTTFQLSDD